MTDDDDPATFADEPGTDWLTLRLTAERPEPAVGLRGTLRRRLVALGPSSSRPAHLTLLATAYALAGTVLLVIGALSAAGIGPLAA